MPKFKLTQFMKFQINFQGCIHLFQSGTAKSGAGEVRGGQRPLDSLAQQSDLRKTPQNLQYYNLSSKNTDTQLKLKLCILRGQNTITASYYTSTCLYNIHANIPTQLIPTTNCTLSIHYFHCTKWLVTFHCTKQLVKWLLYLMAFSMASFAR